MRLFVDLGCGTVIRQRFELESLAGKGAMGSVWRARDTETGETVAVKLMRGDDLEERFLREAIVLSELQHPRIVRYIEHGIEAGHPYLAMEWLDGIDLGHRLAAGALAIPDALHAIRFAAEALAVAHARGVVHRDVKPSNLMLPHARIDELKVLDFGIARLATSNPRLMTRTGMALGTPGYMAPEQARGDRDVDARADVFALGCVLFESLTGIPPFSGEHLLAVLAKVLFEDAPRVRELRPEVSPALDRLVARMVSKQPADRPADARALLAELDVIEAGGDVDAPGTSVTAQVLTAGEQRLLGIVLAGPESADDKALAATAEQPSELGERAAGTQVERLADGSVIAIIGGKSGRSTGGAATDQAARAARCALALRQLRPTVPIAIAIGRGTVAGKLPIGDVIDSAVRMLSRAGAVIRIDDTTAGLLDQRFEVSGDERGLVLRRECANRVLETARTLLGKPTPCVGRERELALLEGVFAEVAAEPTAHAVLVTAPAGAGKSRVVHEFLRKRREADGGSPAGSAGTGIELWIARGDPLSAGSAFAMLGQVVRRSSGILDGEPPAVRQHKLRARVARHVAPEDRVRVTEFLGELAGCETLETPSEMLRAARLTSVLMNDQMKRAWEDFVAADCAVQPVVIVLEDLQWGDPGTIKLVTAALRRASELPLLVVAVARPEVTQLFPGLFSGTSTHIQLGDLTPRAGERLIRAVLGDITPAAVAQITMRANGNAFYLEELIRAVAEGKGDALPETVLAMLQARLEALEPSARRTLRAASIFGQRFWAGGVAALLGNHAAQLDELVDRELIERRNETRFTGEVEYGFRHAIVRDAAYSLLTEDDRRLGHRLAGDWLEQRGERDAITLADHFDVGRECLRAAYWLGRAAAQALEANDFDGTLTRCERGLACGPDGELRGKLLAIALEANHWHGHLVAAAECGEQALTLLPAGTTAWHDCVGTLARNRAALGQELGVVTLAETLEARGFDARDDRCVQAWVNVALRSLFVCRYDVADRLLGPLRAIVRDPGANHNVRGAVHEVLAHRSQVEGDLDEALRLTLASVDDYRRAGNLRDAMYEQIGVAVVQNELGAYEDAERTLRALTESRDAAAIPVVLSVCKHNLGLTLAYLGRAEGEQLEREAIAELTASGDQRLGMAARGYLIRILVATGKLDDAIAIGTEAEQLAREANVDPFNRAVIAAALARALVAAGRPSEALPHARRAAETLDQVRFVEECETLIQLALVEALLGSGDLDAGRDALASANRRLSERAGRIGDARLCASFLERVPENAKLRALAGSAGVILDA